MNDNETPTDEEHRPITRRTYLAGAATAGVAGLAGCSSSDGDGGGNPTGQLATRVTDQPGDIADFESCVVTITGMWLGPAEGEDSEDDEDEQMDDGSAANESTDDDQMDGDDQMDDEETEDEEMDDDESTDDDEPEDEESEGEEGGRTYYEYDEPQEADLVNLQGEQTQLVDDRELDVGSQAFLQLEVDSVDATLESGESAQVEVPGNAPLKFNESFEIRANTRTLFTADFTPVKRGQTGRYNLQPVASGVTVEYEEVEAEGSEDDDGDDSETTTGYRL
jgi:hypothetical protein